MLVLGARLTVDDRGADVADVKPKSSLGVWEALRADRLEEAWTRSSQTTVGGGDGWVRSSPLCVAKKPSPKLTANAP